MQVCQSARFNLLLGDLSMPERLAEYFQPRFQKAADGEIECVFFLQNVQIGPYILQRRNLGMVQTASDVRWNFVSSGAEGFDFTCMSTYLPASKGMYLSM